MSRRAARGPRCCECGRFCGYDAESSTPFGGPTDLEPPDEEFYCAPCVTKNEEHYVCEGWVPTSWEKAPWHRRVAARLGCIEVRLPGAAWTVWAPREHIPPGYEPLAPASPPEAARP